MPLSSGLVWFAVLYRRWRRFPISGIQMDVVACAAKPWRLEGGTSYSAFIIASALGLKLKHLFLVKGCE